jgi:3-methylfumaryl-CoA hydratase
MFSAEHLQDWIGHSQQVQDLLRAQPAQFMQATLDQTPSLKDGDPLPSLWHWLYFLEAARASELGRAACHGVCGPGGA